MTLPYDYARCPGGSHVACLNCQRFDVWDAGTRPRWSVMIAPAVDYTGECVNRIPASPTTDEGERDAA